MSKPSNSESGDHFDSEALAGEMNELATAVARLVALLDDVRGELEAAKEQAAALASQEATRKTVQTAALLSAWIDFELRRVPTAPRSPEHKIERSSRWNTAG